MKKYDVTITLIIEAKDNDDAYNRIHNMVTDIGAKLFSIDDVVEVREEQKEGDLSRGEQASAGTESLKDYSDDNSNECEFSNGYRCGDCLPCARAITLGQE